MIPVAVLTTAYSAKRWPCSLSEHSSTPTLATVAPDASRRLRERLSARFGHSRRLGPTICRQRVSRRARMARDHTGRRLLVSRGAAAWSNASSDLKEQCRWRFDTLDQARRAIAAFIRRYATTA